MVMSEISMVALAPVKNYVYILWTPQHQQQVFYRQNCFIPGALEGAQIWVQEFVRQVLWCSGVSSCYLNGELQIYFEIIGS